MGRPWLAEELQTTHTRSVSPKFPQKACATSPCSNSPGFREEGLPRHHLREATSSPAATPTACHSCLITTTDRSHRHFQGAQETGSPPQRLECGLGQKSTNSRPAATERGLELQLGLKIITRKVRISPGCFLSLPFVLLGAFQVTSALSIHSVALLSRDLNGCSAEVREVSSICLPPQRPQQTETPAAWTWTQARKTPLLRCSYGECWVWAHLPPGDCRQCPAQALRHPPAGKILTLATLGDAI